ncbi:MAG: hypothetical protein MR333_09320, partial [Porphyromonadaceae bacterium]|nr:hypothetical protein [Porphyromonadaceae bacterium]
TAADGFRSSVCGISTAADAGAGTTGASGFTTGVSAAPSSPQRVSPPLTPDCPLPRAGAPDEDACDKDAPDEDACEDAPDEDACDKGRRGIVSFKTGRVCSPLFCRGRLICVIVDYF